MAKKKQEKEEKKKPEKKKVINIVRLVGKDLNGDYEIGRALIEVKGISFTLSKTLTRIASKELSIDKKEKLGSLNEDQIKKLSDIVTNPHKYGVPPYLLNRRKDRETGEDIHLTGHDLDFKQREDKGLEGKIDSYKGRRHQLGLTVRGQRTRTSGRKGTTVGVRKTARMKKAQSR